MKTYTPLVSCIMPTSDRPQFIKRSVDMFLAQDYANKELIILDDGDYSIKSLVPEHELIRYFNLQKMSLGQKRNTLCNMAFGDIIVHWDDDDFHAFWRIKMQVDALQRSGAGITGLNEIFYRDEETGDGWLYSWPPNRGPWLLGATLAYRKVFWEKILFPNTQYAEDLVFIFCAMAQPIPPYVMTYNRWFVGSRHKTNISGKLVGGHNWKEVELPSWVGEYI